MSFQEIPMDNPNPWFKYKINLSGAIYTLDFRYNSRSSRWIMDISDASGNQILVGLPVLIERNITGQYRTFQIPPGVFMATDDTSKGTQPEIYSFLLDHTLWYREE